MFIAQSKYSKMKDRISNLEGRGTELKEMYTDVLDKLTQVTGTVHNPARQVTNGNRD